MSTYKLAKDIQIGEEVVGPEGLIYTVAAITDYGDALDFGLLHPNGVEFITTAEAFEEMEVAA